MTEVKWSTKAREFANCNCSCGCPCKFNGLPTDGACRAVVGMQIDSGVHGSMRIDGLKVATIFRWPGAIHNGNGEAAFVVDERADALQRAALLRILVDQNTEPGATVFSIFRRDAREGASAYFHQDRFRNRYRWTAGMVQFGKALEQGVVGIGLKELSLELAPACRDSLADSWETKQWGDPYSKAGRR